MKIKALIFLTSLFFIPIENFAAHTSPASGVEVQKAKKKKKKKGGLFKKKCKCPKIK